jgi:ABC-2 type transport system permease protein
LVGAGVVAGLVATDLPLIGSLAFGAATIGAGMVFAAIAAVAAQIASGARAALAVGSGTIAIAFVCRAVGDVGDGRLSWLSPIGWAQAVRPFAEERWWVLLLPVAAAVGFIGLAVSLQMRRDLGAGMFQQRPGPAAAGPRLSTPLGLAVRLHRPTIIGWTIGLALLAFFYGIVADQAESILEDNPDMADFLAMLGQGSITDVYLATSMLMMGLMATGFTLAALLRMRGEETTGRSDMILATRTSRRRWVASHLALAFGGTVVVMTACGLAMGLGFASVTGDMGKVPSLLVAALAMVPAMMAVGGLALLVYGLVPRWSLAVWGALAFIIAVGVLQAVLDLPQWVLDLSPFEHVPAMPAAGFDLAPLALLCAAGVALGAIGLAAFNRRDIA